jgi:predicted TIM-barrel fold metal-dependent hydrolase
LWPSAWQAAASRKAGWSNRSATGAPSAIAPQSAATCTRCSGIRALPGPPEKAEPDFQNRPQRFSARYIDHVTIATPSIDEDIGFYRTVGHRHTAQIQAEPVGWMPLHVIVENTAKPAGLIALFHTGTTGIGAGMPGGGGVRLKYSNPMCVDDVAADFPELDIILAHPSFPWQDEALAIAVHKPNVYIDLSGWSPKYFPEILIQYTNTRRKNKMLFGSDYPQISPDRWLADFETLPIKDEVRPLVLKENAAQLLGLR